MGPIQYGCVHVPLLFASGRHVVSCWFVVQGDEYLCPHCRVQLSLAIIEDLKREDRTKIFWEPVTADLAETYLDVIRSPMDLATMNDKAISGKYKSLQSLRQDYELMCLNAITFNKVRTQNIWK